MSIFFDRETAKKLAEARWKAGFPETLPKGQHAPRALVRDIIDNAEVTMEVTISLTDTTLTYEQLREAIEAALVGPYLGFRDPEATAEAYLEPSAVTASSLAQSLELERVKFDILSEINDIRQLQQEAKTPTALQYVADRTQALQKKIEKAGLSYDPQA